MSKLTDTRPARLPPTEKAALDARMNLAGAPVPRREGTRVLYPAIDRVQAGKLLALLASGARSSVRASRLPAAARRDLDERMGIASSRTSPIRHERSTVRYGVMTPEQARAHLATLERRR